MMASILDEAEVQKAQKILAKHKLQSFKIGSIKKASQAEQIQYS